MFFLTYPNSTFRLPNILRIARLACHRVDCVRRGLLWEGIFCLIQAPQRDAEYIGETKRAIRIREKEHRDAVRLGQCAKLAVAEHVHSSVVPHEVDWSSLQVLDRAGRKMECKIREAFHIYKRKPVMNRDTGVDRSQTWNAIL